MPGLVVFRRRWSAGSDDLVVPGAFLLIIHIVCFIVILASLSICDYDTKVFHIELLFYHQIGYLVILCLSVCSEIGICVISMRGSILDSDLRNAVNVWIYLKSAIILFDVVWLALGSLWLANYYVESSVNALKKIFFGIVVSNWALVFVTVITVWCSFDAAGRSWVKMKKYQRSMRETSSRLNYKRSNSVNRNWRQRKVIRAYQDSWDHRCRLLFCCMGYSERNRNSFADIARLLSDFFRELDVVPSDVVAGLVLLRKFQRLEREAIVRQRKNGTYEFLSGVPITERTQFLALSDAKNYDFLQTVIHYMYFAQGAYGWPMYFITNQTRLWHLVPELGCFSCRTQGGSDGVGIVQDNCCYCNYAALKKTLQIGDIEIVYVTYHVDVGETPFFVAIDYTQKKIVISIRGTLSMKDILTDLNAEGEVLPLNPPRDDWLGHKGMIQAALYIRNKLHEEHLIEKAFNRNPERHTQSFDLVLVGHSLGAGAASILAILMKADYPTLQCFSYSPPGGLLSMPAVEYSKTFITSVVLGKDVVPRIGLYQMEALRADLINAIQRSVDPKWKTISCSILCCGCGPEPTSVLEMSGRDTDINKYQEARDTARSTCTHPTDSSIALTLHQPLYPPGRIIHIVRHHPKPDENILQSREPVYQAIWADASDFDEVLISPVMLQDHMPDKILAALKKVLTTSGPRKPHRHASNTSATTIAANEACRGALDAACCSERAKASGRGVTITNDSSCSALEDVGFDTGCRGTTFANTDSPTTMTDCRRSGKNVDNTPSSRTSSPAESISSRSQISPRKSLLTPPMGTEVRTLVGSETTIQQHCTQRPKVVAFSVDLCNSTSATESPSPRGVLKSILHRQNSARSQDSQDSKSRLLATGPRRRASDVPYASVDLWHNDCLGLAPLASPETLSEISSISSRNSIRIHMVDVVAGKERNLHHVPNANADLNGHKNGGAVGLGDIFESQLHTPTVMRRAPKFSENLSTCAEDSRNLDQYKQLTRVVVRRPLPGPCNPDSTEEEDSCETTSCRKPAEWHTSPSESEDHKLTITTTTTTTTNNNNNSNSNNSSKSDSVILNEEGNGCHCRSSIYSRNEISKEKHSCSVCRSSVQCVEAEIICDSFRDAIDGSIPSSIDQSASSSLDVDTSGRPGILESHFPVFDTSPIHNDDTSQWRPKQIQALNHNTSVNEQRGDLTGRGRHCEGDRPLLVQISERPCAVPSLGHIRKGCVYPSQVGGTPKESFSVSQLPDPSRKLPLHAHFHPFNESSV